MRTIREVYGLDETPDDVEVGVEIEVEGDGLPVIGLPSTWRGTGDGSLRGEAVEYVMSMPLPRGDSVYTALIKLQYFLAKTGSTIDQSERCGVHVHINCQGLTEPQVLCFALLYYTVEEALVKFCAPHREDNLFCLRVNDATDVLYGLHTAVQQGSFNRVATDRYRYASLNFSSLPKYGSLEFRILETPQDFSKISKWVALLLKIKDRSLEYGNAIHILENVSGMGGEQFLKHVFQEHADVFEGMNNLHHMVMEGVRRVQHIAYTPWSVREEKRKNLRPGGMNIDAIWQDLQGMQEQQRVQPAFNLDDIPEFLDLNEEDEEEL